MFCLGVCLLIVLEKNKMQVHEKVLMCTAEPHLEARPKKTASAVALGVHAGERACGAASLPVCLHVCLSVCLSVSLHGVSLSSVITTQYRPVHIDDLNNFNKWCDTVKAAESNWG